MPFGGRDQSANNKTHKHFVDLTFLIVSTHTASHERKNDSHLHFSLISNYVCNQTSKLKEPYSVSAAAVTHAWMAINEDTKIQAKAEGNVTNPFKSNKYTKHGLKPFDNTKWLHHTLQNKAKMHIAWNSTHLCPTVFGQFTFGGIKMRGNKKIGKKNNRPHSLCLAAKTNH